MSRKHAEVAKAAARRHREQAAALADIDPKKARWHQKQADALTKRARREMES